MAKQVALPLEILETIPRLLDDRADLLSLALTHSFFRDVIIPFELNYRVIECHVNDEDMWNHLLEDRRRLVAVRRLVISCSMYSRRRIPPQMECPVGSTPDGSHLLQALKEMPNLQSVCWDDAASEIPIAMPTLNGDPDSLWNAIMESCPLVTEIEASGKFACPSCRYDERRSHAMLMRWPSNIYALANLRRFKHTFNCTDKRHKYDFSALRGLLLSSPLLEDLVLNGTDKLLLRSTDLDGLTYQRLVSLDLEHLSFQGGYQQIYTLLQQCPNIEHLRIFCCYIWPEHDVTNEMASSNTILLRLRSLTAPQEVVRWINPDTLVGREPPSLHVTTTASAVINLPIDLRKIGHSIKALKICLEHGEMEWKTFVETVSETCPNLRELHVSASIYSFSLPTSWRGSPNTDAWATIMDKFKYLEAMSPPAGMASDIGLTGSDRRKRQSMLSKLLSACPTLHVIANSTRFVVFVQQEQPDINKGSVKLDSGMIKKTPWALYDSSEAVIQDAFRRGSFRRMSAE